MDYSLLFIKAAIPKLESPKFKRMPALIFNKDKRELTIKQVDDREMGEILKRKARKSALVSNEVKEVFVNEFIQSYLESESDMHMAMSVDKKIEIDKSDSQFSIQLDSSEGDVRKGEVN